jgi:predicted DCC family thiol-disulfide oxidoreductase YuxK
MSFKEKVPIIVFDNHCYLCVKFAKIINFFSRGKIAIIGHYSSLGQKIREEILDDSALEMFWFINEKNAFGGRAALLPLVKAIINLNEKETVSANIDEKCDKDCKTAKAVFFRSISLLSNSKKIEF